MEQRAWAQKLRDDFPTIFEMPEEPFPKPLPESEIVPYKSLSEIFNFVDLCSKDQLPQWMDIQMPLTSGTSFCYRQMDMLSQARQAFIRRSVPKTMVCHDFKGGYLMDRFVDYHFQDEDGYLFTQWNLIDSFVYFSHYLVTVPPPCWISAGHAHGVKVLGTFITEDKTGLAFWEDLLAVEQRWKWLAEALVLINHVHQMDGFLLNVENFINPAYVPNLVLFVKYLREILPRTSMLIWYDSVVNTGILRWQNMLNKHNLDFFNACDGIFLNYNYQDWQLKQSAQLAAARCGDVYVGIDAFGRGCPGSGFFCSDAAAMARKYELSIAIFAPGWAVEVVPSNSILNTKTFWSALSNYLFVHGTASQITRPIHLLGGMKKGESNFNSLTGQTTNTISLWTGDKASVMLALPTPSVDPTKQSDVLVNVQDAVVTYKEHDIRRFYSMLPVPILDVSEDAEFDLNKSLVIDTRNLMEEKKMPLMLFEVPIKTGLHVRLLAKAAVSETSLSIYATVEDDFGVLKDVSISFLLRPDVWFSQAFQRVVTGKLLEVGFLTSPNTMALVSRVTVREMKAMSPEIK